MLTVLLVIAMLLSVYGLSCLVSDLILWLTAPHPTQKYVLLVPLEHAAHGCLLASSVKERLRRCGLVGNIRVIYLTDTAAKEMDGTEEKNLLVCTRQNLCRHL